MQFTPLVDFDSKELRSSYCVGLSYRARDEDELLLSLLPKWIADGLVCEGAPVVAVSKSEVAGDGDIT